MNQAIYPHDFAAKLVKRAGEKYRPSNGTEGQLFLDAFCRRCQRDAAMRTGVGSPNDAQRCDLIGMTMLHEVTDPEYPQAW
ncbi:MAG: hypothetical protein KGZ68_12725 [Dechloromonas sp.]|nr:hypothetical protein [Dechloromonas sp.]